MKLREFNSQNCLAVKNVVPSISGNLKSGIVRLNKGLVALLKLNNGSPVVFTQDEESPEDWYIATKEGGLSFRKDRSGGSSRDNDVLVANSMYLVKSIVKSLDIPLLSFRMYVGTEPTEIEGILYYPIITKSWK